MVARKSTKPGTKRTSDGKEKRQTTAATAQNRSKDAVDLNKTPPRAQRLAQSNTSIETQSTVNNSRTSKKQKGARPENDPAQTPHTQTRPSKRHPPHKNKEQKRPRLPDHVTISKRPLHHPPISTPFSSSTSPKILYLTYNAPFIPTIKRIRHHLSEITRREKQSFSTHSKNVYLQTRQKRNPKPLEANGRLKAADVESEIVGAIEGQGNEGQEEVFVKATGRAIERALQVGVHFQGEDDCTVRVEMGSMSAVDDINVQRRKRKEADADGDVAMGEGLRKQNDRRWADEDIPETRVRTLSSITVAISLK